jgi:hypothetical protein
VRPLYFDSAPAGGYFLQSKDENAGVGGAIARDWPQNAFGYFGRNGEFRDFELNQGNSTPGKHIQGGLS